MRMAIWAALAAVFGVAAVFVMPLFAVNSAICLGGIGAEWSVGRRGYDAKRHNSEVLSKMFSMLIAAGLVVAVAVVIIVKRALLK